jgi:hypothetical protein
VGPATAGVSGALSGVWVVEGIDPVPDDMLDGDELYGVLDGAAEFPLNDDQGLFMELHADTSITATAVAANLYDVFTIISNSHPAGKRQRRKHLWSIES